MVVLINERLLVVAVGLVASGEFDQMVNNNADTRVNRRLALDTGTYCRSLGS